MTHEERFKKAEYYTDVHNFRKAAQDLLEKGYKDQGLHVSTMLKCLEKNSKDLEDAPYAKWLVGMDSKVMKVGHPNCYWDMSTHIQYKNSRSWKNAFEVDFIVNNKPKVTGDIKLGFLDIARLTASVELDNFRESMKLELLCFVEHMALKVRGVGYVKKNFKKTDFYVPRRVDASAALYASCLKLGVEGSYDVYTKKYMDCCVGGGITTYGFMTSAVYGRNSLSVSCIKQFNRHDLGVEVSKPIFSEKPTLTIGTGYYKDDQIWKLKFNNHGVVSGCIQKKLGTDAVLSVCSQVNLKHMFKCPKVGLKLILEPAATCQTYDVGVNSWEDGSIP